MYKETDDKRTVLLLQRQKPDVAVALLCLDVGRPCRDLRPERTKVLCQGMEVKSVNNSCDNVADQKRNQQGTSTQAGDLSSIRVEEHDDVHDSNKKQRETTSGRDERHLNY